MITTVTLNASVDKAYHMAEVIENGTVMRVAECRNSAGGKGLNVARVVKLCGSDLQATGLSGGFNGQYLEHMLEQDGIRNAFVHIAGETRSCINILDPKYSSTEYLEPGCKVSPLEEKAFLEKFPTIIADSDVVTLSGSAPKGMSKDIYRKLVEIAKNAGKQVILDTSGQLLAEGMKANPTMIKPNKDEIEALYNIKIQNREEVIEYAKKMHEDGIKYVVVSLGGDGALLVCDEGIYHGISPKVEVVNTVGCGDSMVGAFAVALERKYTPQEALKYAVAVGTANALSPHTGSFDMFVMADLLQKVTVKEI